MVIEIHINGSLHARIPVSEVLPEGSIMERTIAGEALQNQIVKHVQETVLRWRPERYEVYLIFESKMNKTQTV